MTATILPSRSPSGSPAFSPANRPVYRGGAAAVAASGFDPATLSWTSGRVRRWFHVNEATILKTVSPPVVAAVGEPIARIISQASSDTFNYDYFGGTAPTRAATYVNMNSSTTFLTSFPSSITPKDTGLTVAAKVENIQNDTFIFGDDYSPVNNCAYFVVGATKKMRVYGDAGSFVETDDLAAYIAGGGNTFVYTLEPNAGGTCTVKIYTDSGTPVKTGTVTSTGTMNRSIEYSTQNLMGLFFGAQDFSANVTDILEFLNNGSGA